VAGVVDTQRAFCDNVDVKNITVSIEDSLQRRARIKAAERGTSLSAAVRDFLIHFCGSETDFERRKRLERETLASVRSFDAGNRVGRDALHGRHALR
jgi:hypothetical protein